MSENTMKIIRVGEKSTDNYAFVPVDKILYVDCRRPNASSETKSDHYLRIGLENGGYQLEFCYKDVQLRDAEAERIARILSGVEQASDDVSADTILKYDAVFFIHDKSKMFKCFNPNDLLQAVVYLNAKEHDDCNSTVLTKVEGRDYIAYGLVTTEEKVRSGSVLDEMVKSALDEPKPILDCPHVFNIGGRNVNVLFSVPRPAYE